VKKFGKMVNLRTKSARKPSTNSKVFTCNFWTSIEGKCQRSTSQRLLHQWGI